jgi:O-antigen/teichoic acid export membrane protein
LTGADLARRMAGSESGWMFAGEALNRGSRFLLLLLLARALGPDRYGEWVIAVALATLLGNLSDAGLNLTATSAIAADKASTRKYVGNLWAAAGLIAFGTCALGIIAIWVLDTGISIILIVGLSGSLDGAIYMLLAPLRAHGKMKAEGLVRALQGSSLLLSGAMILAWVDGTAMAVAIVFPVVGLGCLALAGVSLILTLGYVPPEFDIRFLARAIGRSFPVLFSTAIFFVYFRIDVLMLGYLKGPGETGIYGAAYNLAFGATFFAVIFGRTRLASLAAAEFSDELRRLYRRCMSDLLRAVVSLSAGLLALTLVLVHLYGDAFASSRIPYLVLIGAQALLFFTQLNYITLIARGRGRIASILGLSALLVNVVMNFALIPPLGAVGAALAMIASESTLLAGQMRVIGKLLKYNDREGNAASGRSESIVRYSMPEEHNVAC